MASLTVAWGAAFETTPANSDDLAGGDDRIREFKKSVREMLDEDHRFSTIGHATSDGYHDKVTLIERTDPTAVASACILFIDPADSKLKAIFPGPTVVDIASSSGLEVGTIASDTINESTSGAGVTADGVLLKDGTIQTSTPVAAWGYLSSSLSSQDLSTATEIMLGAEIYDTLGYFNVSNGRFTPLVAGKYLTIAKCSISSWDNAATGSVSARKNGASTGGSIISGDLHLDDPSSNDATGLCMGVFDMNGSTDYISMFIDSGSDTSVTVTGGSTASNTYLHCIRIA